MTIASAFQRTKALDLRSSSWLPGNGGCSRTESYSGREWWRKTGGDSRSVRCAVPTAAAGGLPALLRHSPERNPANPATPGSPGLPALLVRVDRKDSLCGSSLVRTRTPYTTALPRKRECQAARNLCSEPLPVLRPSTLVAMLCPRLCRRNQPIPASGAKPRFGDPDDFSQPPDETGI